MLPRGSVGNILANGENKEQPYECQPRQFFFHQWNRHPNWIGEVDSSMEKDWKILVNPLPINVGQCGLTYFIF